MHASLSHVWLSFSWIATETHCKEYVGMYVVSNPLLYPRDCRAIVPSTEFCRKWAQALLWGFEGLSRTHGICHWANGVVNRWLTSSWPRIVYLVLGHDSCAPFIPKSFDIQPAPGARALHAFTTPLYLEFQRSNSLPLFPSGVLQRVLLAHEVMMHTFSCFSSTAVHFNLVLWCVVCRSFFLDLSIAPRFPI